jgi:hypothetical protein
MMISFARNMADFIHSLGKKHVLVLSSLDSGRRKQIDASRYGMVHAMQCFFIGGVNLLFVRFAMSN